MNDLIIRHVTLIWAALGYVVHDSMIHYFMSLKGEIGCVICDIVMRHVTSSWLGLFYVKRNIMIHYVMSLKLELGCVMLPQEPATLDCVPGPEAVLDAARMGDGPAVIARLFSATSSGADAER